MKRLSKMKTAWLLIMLTALLLPGSRVLAGPDRAAKQAFGNADYSSAVRILAGKLRKKTDHQDNIALMQKSLDLGQRVYLRQAEECMATSKFDCAASEFARAKNLFEIIQDMPPVHVEFKKDGKKKKREHWFEVLNVTEKYYEARDKALTYNYQRGIDREKSGRFRNAAENYKQVLIYDEDYKDAFERYEYVRNKASIRVAIMPFENISGKYGYGQTGTRVTDELLGNAVNSQPEFVQFVTRDHLARLIREQGLQQSDLFDPEAVTEVGLKVGVRVFVFGKILSVVEHYPQDYVESGTATKKIKNKDGQRSQVSVNWHKYTRTGEVRVTASYQIIDVETGTILSAERETATGSSHIMWTRYTGDHRALPSAVVSHNQHNKNKHPTNPEVLIEEAITKLSAKLAEKLVNYVNNETRLGRSPKPLSLQDN